MKRLLPFIVIIASTSAFAESSAPAASPAAAPSVSERPSMPMLTTEENQTLMAALQKAQLDPAVKAANEKKQQAIAAARAVMIAKDPSLAPLLDKILPTSSPAPGTPRPILTADERMQWSAAQQAIQGTPEADAVLKARLDYARALHSAMLAADPAVAAIFDKLPQNGMVAHPHSAAAASPAPSAQ